MSEPIVTEQPDRSRRSGILGWLVTVAIAAAAVWVVLWSGLAFNIVATDSMVPTLDPTDMVITVGTNVIEPEIGSVIVFTADFLDSPIPPHVHRIVGVEPNGNWITKGDNAVNPDPWRVEPADVQGVMIGSAPTQLVRNPVLLGAALFIVLVALFWPRGSKGDEQPDVEGTEEDRELVKPTDDAGVALLPGGPDASAGTGEASGAGEPR